MKKLNDTLNKIVTILSSDKDIKWNPDLVQFTGDKIVTPIGDVSNVLLRHKSKLNDTKINVSALSHLIDTLNSMNAILRLDHVGFCYKVASQESEITRIQELVAKTKLHLYQEESNDDGLWLFIGNTIKWEDPMLELLPVEKTNGQWADWVDYWLPHIQIDVDIKLNSDEIDKMIKDIYGNKTIKPHHIIIDDIVYIVRSHLGVIDGVNIFLDLATSARDVKWHRRHKLVQI